MKSVIVNTLKIGISAAILVVLCWKGWQSLKEDPAAFEQLVHQPKHWLPIGVAVATCLSAVVITILRWRTLVVALGMPFPVRDALRLGFVGYLLNFTLSVVGGDLVKVVGIAHRNPQRKAAAAATVVVDRLIGMYALFVVGAVASLFLDFSQIADPTQRVVVERICLSIRAASLIGTAAFLLVLLPGFATSSLWEILRSIPKVGGGLMNMLEAVRMYRRQPLLLVALIALSLTTHSMFAFAICLIGWGLPGPDPSVAANFIVAPVSMAASAAPLPGGVGAFEATFAFMYQALSPADVAKVQGLVIAVAYRAITLFIAAIGGIYYVLDRREVKQLLEEAKENEVAVAAAKS